MAASLREYLENTLVSDLSEDARMHADPAGVLNTLAADAPAIVSVDISQSANDALRVLHEHHILSAPVRDAEAEVEYVGSVDTLDLLRVVLKSIIKDGPTAGGKVARDIEWGPVAHSISELRECGEHLAAVPVKDCMDLSHKNPFAVVLDTGNVWQLIEDSLSNLHRVGVASKDATGRQHIKGIVSQLDVVHILTDYFTGLSDEDDELSNQSIKEAGIGTRAIISMSFNAPAIAAFFLMMWNNVSAVAITDKDGRLVANLSASDLTGVTPDNIARLALPVREYLTTRLQLRSGARHIVEGPRPPVSVHESASVSQTLWKMSAYRLHRVWIVDQDGAPIGVVSCSDVVRWVKQVCE